MLIQQRISSRHETQNENKFLYRTTYHCKEVIELLQELESSTFVQMYQCNAQTA